MNHSSDQDNISNASIPYSVNMAGAQQCGSVPIFEVQNASIQAQIQQAQQPSPQIPIQSQKTDDSRYQVHNLSHRVSIVTQNLAHIGDFIMNESSKSQNVNIQQQQQNVQNLSVIGMNQSNQSQNLNPLQQQFQNFNLGSSVPQQTDKCILQTNIFDCLLYNNNQIEKKHERPNYNPNLGQPLKNSDNQTISSPFESAMLPAIPAGLYLYIVCEKLSIPDEHTIIILALIERVCHQSHLQYNQRLSKENQNLDYGVSQNKKDPQWKVEINSKTIHRLIIVSILVTQKFFSDFFWGNQFVAEIGGIQNVKELNELELYFLELLDYKVTVTTDQYNHYHQAFSNFFSNPLPKLTRDVVDKIQNAIHEMEKMYAEAEEEEDDEEVEEEESEEIHQSIQKENKNTQNSSNNLSANQSQMNLNNQLLQQAQMQQQLAQQNSNAQALNNQQTLLEMQQLHQQQMNQQLLQYLMIDQMLKDNQMQEQQSNQGSNLGQQQNQYNNALAMQQLQQNNGMQNNQGNDYAMQMSAQQYNGAVQQLLLLNQQNQQQILNNQYQQLNQQQPMQQYQQQLNSMQAQQMQQQQQFQMGNNMQFQNSNQQQPIFQQNFNNNQIPQNGQQYDINNDDEDDCCDADVDEMIDQQDLSSKVNNHYIGNFKDINHQSVQNQNMPVINENHQIQIQSNINQPETHLSYVNVNKGSFRNQPNQYLPNDMNCEQKHTFVEEQQQKQPFIQQQQISDQQQQIQQQMQYQQQQMQFDQNQILNMNGNVQINPLDFLK